MYTTNGRNMLWREQSCIAGEKLATALLECCHFLQHNVQALISDRRLITTYMAQTSKMRLAVMLHVGSRTVKKMLISLILSAAVDSTADVHRKMKATRQSSEQWVREALLDISEHQCRIVVLV